VLNDPYKLLELISLARGVNTPPGQVTDGTRVSEIVLRDSRSEMAVFEIVELELEDRRRLRALLQGNHR
jgi:hypothetical protein